MTGTRRLRLMIVVSLALMKMQPGLDAQFGSLVSPGQAAQARSQEELDSYLEIVSATNPQDVVVRVKAFASEFPQSELLSGAYQYQLQAFEKLNDLDGMLAAGEKALAGNSDNSNTLLTLASAMASRAAARPDRTKLLAQAEDYAGRVLAGIEKIRIPHTLKPEEWGIQKRQMQSEAHGIFGMVEFQRGQLQKAISDFQISLDAAPHPEGIQFLRLGVALAASGKQDDAKQKLQRAAELGPDPVHNLAVDQLKRLTGREVAPR